MINDWKLTKAVVAGLILGASLILLGLELFSPSLTINSRAIVSYGLEEKRDDSHLRRGLNEEFNSTNSFLDEDHNITVSTFNSTTLTYSPGNLVECDKYLGLMLSKGLSCKLIAQHGEFVPYPNGSYSDTKFHKDPDAGAVFPDPRPDNQGGWIYVSNAESSRYGGVGALTFNSKGEVIDYRYVLPKGQSVDNCGGGKTPWNTWISCEEHDYGFCWQVDPTGERPAEKTVLGMGPMESAAVDYRNPAVPRFFVTEDSSMGPLRRFTPSPETVAHAAELNDTWILLHDANGTMEYLVVDNVTNTYHWTTSEWEGRQTAQDNYPGMEGIDIVEQNLYFVAKKEHLLYSLNLDDGTYNVSSTTHGEFDGEPDQIQSTFGNNDLLYFTEDGNFSNGIHGRDAYSRSFTVLEGNGKYKSETTGLAFSLNNDHLYFAFQDQGSLFDCFRDDGHSFTGKALNMKYN